MTDPGTGPIAFRYEAAVFSLGLSRGPAAAEASSGATAPALLTAHSLALRTLAGESLLMAQVNKAVSNQEPIQKATTLMSAPAPVSQQPDAGQATEFIAMGAPAADKEASKQEAMKQCAQRERSEAEITAAGKIPYWMRTCKHIKSPFLRLHQEMVELTELLHPSQAEIDARNEAVEAVTQAVTSIWPSASVAIFGSFATGLFVPTSDVDLVILDSKCTDIQSGLKALSAALMRKSVAQNVQVIGRARVPIIKFETTGFGRLAFDVSFDVANGPEAAELVKEFCGKWPMMRPLVLVLKLFLQQRELNEVYTGGIGSYALITMVCAFLQLHNSRRPAAKGKAALLEPSLGVLLVDFFRLFGRVVNTPGVGMAASNGGSFFRKGDAEHRDWIDQEKPYKLAIEDPKDPSNDICRSSYNIMRVKSAFDFAYQQLTAPSLPHESMLARILRLGAILVSRTAPPNPRKLYLSSGPPSMKGGGGGGSGGGGGGGGGSGGGGGGSGGSGGGAGNGASAGSKSDKGQGGGGRGEDNKGSSKKQGDKRSGGGGEGGEERSGKKQKQQELQQEGQQQKPQQQQKQQQQGQRGRQPEQPPPASKQPSNSSQQGGGPLPSAPATAFKLNPAAASYTPKSVGKQATDFPTPFPRGGAQRRGSPASNQPAGRQPPGIQGSGKSWKAEARAARQEMRKLKCAAHGNLGFEVGLNGQSQKIKKKRSCGEAGKHKCQRKLSKQARRQQSAIECVPS